MQTNFLQMQIAMDKFFFRVIVSLPEKFDRDTSK